MTPSTGAPAFWSPPAEGEEARVREALTAWAYARIDSLRRAPAAWGNVQSVEAQYLTALELIDFSASPSGQRERFLRTIRASQSVAVRHFGSAKIALSAYVKDDDEGRARLIELLDEVREVYFTPLELLAHQGALLHYNALFPGFIMPGGR